MIINVLVIIMVIIALSCLGYTAYYIVKTRAHDDDAEAKLLSAAILIILAAMALFALFITYLWFVAGGPNGHLCSRVCDAVWDY